MNYVFENERFYDDEIDRIHALYMNFLETALSGNEFTFDKKSFIKPEDDEEEKRRKIAIAQRAVYLQESHLFDVCSAGELMQLAESASQQKCTMDEALLSEGDETEKVGIVAVGSIEESMVDFEGMVKSLRVLAPGQFFGVEALFENHAMKNSYNVVSEEAIIVWLSKDDLLEILNRKPDIYRAILAAEHEHLYKVQRLWTME